MKPIRIPLLPTRLNTDVAWAEYHALVMAADADKALWAELGHCMAMARAHERWQSLFLAGERAA